MANLTKRTVDAAAPRDRDYFVWCGVTRGFGVRIYPTGTKMFVVQLRVGRSLRRIKIGAYGPFTVDQARAAASELIRTASLGRDPQREKREAKSALTVSELLDVYMEAARAGLVMTRFRVPKRAATVAIDEGRVSRHLKPLIGSIPARDLRRADVQKMVDLISHGHTKGTYKGNPRGKAVVKGGANTAARAASLLGGVYSWAEKRDLVPGPNPARNVDTVKCQPRDRYLSTAELMQLGKRMAGAEVDTPAATAAQALRLIALTGIRREEACRLQWVEIDAHGQCLRLLESKTGKSVRPIGAEAIALLQSLPRRSDKWVFPNKIDTGSADLKKEIAALFDRAGLRDARSHDLRRTFASAAADEGYPLYAKNGMPLLLF